jgi:hypothetical protein
MTKLIVAFRNYAYAPKNLKNQCCVIKRSVHRYESMTWIIIQMIFIAFNEILNLGHQAELQNNLVEQEQFRSTATVLI